MKLSLAWLRDFVDIQESPERVAELLLKRGFEVSGFSRVGGDITGVVTARIETAEKHPNADKLKVCTVFDGEQRHHVVCGAPNAAAGGVYPLARLGARLPGDFLIEKRALRGVESHGMMCSARELGLGDDHAGLFELPADTPLGKNIVDVLGLDDTVLEIEVTPNRPDALSHWGIARELAAALGRKLNVNVPPSPGGPARRDLATVRDAACGYYAARVIDGVAVGPSPLWLRLRLERCGQRAINNVVDVTNYVLLDLGHPLHAFDRKTLAGGGVVVRRGAAGETLACLDGVTRSVEGLLVIADRDRPVAAAGVMGGQPTAVGSTTTELLLESAVFAPAEVRRSRRSLNLSTESSYRFERGTDATLAAWSARRAAALIVELAGGRAVGVQTVAAKKKSVPAVSADPGRVAALVGIPLTPAQIKSALSPLGFVGTGSGKKLRLKSPPHRADVRDTADVAEEVARSLGLDRVPERVRGATVSPEGDTPLRRLVLAARNRFVGLGFLEAKTAGLIPRALWEKWAGAGAEVPAEVDNPLSLSGECLTPSLLAGLMPLVEGNLRRGNTLVRLFETARVFHRGGEGVAEADHLAWAAVGRSHGGHWNRPARALDVWDAKSWVKAFLKDIRLAGVRFAPPDVPFLHPVEAQSVWMGETPLGIFGRVHPRTAEVLGLPGDTFVGELNLTAAAAGPRAAVAFAGLSRQPALVRDFSLVFPENVSWASIVFWIHREIAAAESVDLFDVFTGAGLPAGRRSLGFRVTFRHADKTLTDAEAQTLHTQVIQGLSKTFQAELRAPEANV